MARIIGLPCAILAMAGTAHATFFSFASDNDAGSWTWSGAGNALGDAQDPADPVVLLIDDANGVLPPLEIQADFDADFSVTFSSSTPVAPGVFVHTYSVDGVFSFLDATGSPILSVTVQDAVLTAPGSENAWGSAAAILGSDSFTSVVYESFISQPAYGLFEGLSIDFDDFGFTMTVLNTSGNIPFDGEGLGVPLGSDGLPAETFFSEGSFSGSATFIPAPGSLALLGLGGLVCLRRRSR